MATIIEDYVNFETAKLLKEKGFDEPCFCISYPLPSGEHFNTIFPSPFNNSEITLTKKYKFCKYKEDFITIPTHQMVMKWLREIHNWAICISPYWEEGDMRNKLTWYYSIHSLIDNRSFRESSYTDNYTEACENAIKYCIKNLI